MGAQCLFCNAFIALIILFIAPHLSKSDDGPLPLPTFAFSWMDDDDEFIIGDIATIKVKVSDNFKIEEYKYPFNPDISVNDTKGNSSYITDVHSDFGTDLDNWRIFFTTTKAGFFQMLITDEHFNVSDSSMHFHVISDEDYKPPKFSYHLLNDKIVYTAGDTAIIKVVVYDNFNPKTYRHPYNPNITIGHLGETGKMGNSSYICELRSTLGQDTNKWQFQFTIIMTGEFFVSIRQDNIKEYDSGLRFTVVPAKIYPPGGVVSWKGEVENVPAGTDLTVLILPKDAFGNNVTSKTERNKVYDYRVYPTHANGSDAYACVLNVRNIRWIEFGYLAIDFTAATSGSLLIHVEHENLPLIGSPLTLTVDTGPIWNTECVPHWNVETNYYQIFSKMETFITQKDFYGNTVPGFYEFDWFVKEQETNVSVTILEWQYEEVAPGIQLLAFQLLQPGDFWLMITDKPVPYQIKYMPHEFSVFVAYCDGLKSVVNGSGLSDSVAGEVSKFSIDLRDAYEFPVLVELRRLRVKITLPSLSLQVAPQIYPLNPVAGTQPTGILNFGAFDPTEIDSVPSVQSHNNVSSGSSTTLHSVFEVVYVAEKSGKYEIRIFCGSFALNEGRPYKKFVSPGKVNTTVSRVVKYESNAPISKVNGVDLMLMDSFSNPVLIPDSEKSKLLLEPTDPSLMPLFKVFLWVKSSDGTYTGFYMAMILGTYELCACFDNQRIEPCSFKVNVYKMDDFPLANEDTVSVWEDQSVGFSAIENDYFVGGDATLAGFQKPVHGSAVVQYGTKFRYTPYKGYYGTDSFTYTISDVVGRTASTVVNVFVHANPPKLVSFPTDMQVDEDTLGPRYGGFSGFNITYSDPTENISVMLSALHGSVFLSPLIMQLWDPKWNELSVSKMEGGAKELYIVGRLEVINFALQSFKYTGEGNFSGSESISVATINKYGKNDYDVPIMVKPINDPPFIDVPEFILLNVTEDEDLEDEGFLIFDRQRDNFTFSIGDPDLLHYPGNKSNFRVMFSIEVSSGYFSAKLPAEVINSTELKFKNSKQWQPLQSFVAISRQITVIAKAIRFRGSIDACNTVLHQLLYYGDEDGGVIRMIVNDMGFYGCYPDCTNMMTAPLIAEATINLITKAPMNSVVAHYLASVIVIEAVVLSTLAVTLMFFTCKCVIVLLHRKKRNQPQSQNFQLYKVQSSHKHKSTTRLSEDMTGHPSRLSKPLHQESGLG